MKQRRDEEDVFDAQNDPTDADTTSDRSDVPLDRLASIQAKYQHKTNTFDIDLDYWEKQKLALLALGPIADENLSCRQDRSLKAKIKKILEEIKSYIESPDLYLRELFSRTKPAIKALTMQLDGLINQITAIENKPENADEIRRLRVQVCNTNIAIINGCHAMTNNVNREIDYCVKFVNTTEEIASNLIQYVVGLKIPLPKLDLGIGGHYRMTLYNMIHDEMEKIYHFITGSQGVIERARQLFAKKEVQTGLGLFAHKNISSSEPIARKSNPASLFQPKRQPHQDSDEVATKETGFPLRRVASCQGF